MSFGRQNQSQEVRFDDLLAFMAPEIDKTTPKKLDLMTFCLYGSRNRQNKSQEA